MTHKAAIKILAFWALIASLASWYLFSENVRLSEEKEAISGQLRLFLTFQDSGYIDSSDFGLRILPGRPDSSLTIRFK